MGNFPIWLLTIGLLLSGIDAQFVVIGSDLSPESVCAATTCLNTLVCKAQLTCIGTDCDVIGSCLDPQSLPSDLDGKCQDANFLTTIVSTSGDSALTCSSTSPCPEGSDCVGSTVNQDGVCCAGVLEKPGLCRVPAAGEVGICAFTCQNDNGCPNDEKCCKTACGGTSCAPPSVDLCGGCQEGEECRTDIVCTDPPCAAAECRPKSPVVPPYEICATIRCISGSECRVRVPCDGCNPEGFCAEDLPTDLDERCTNAQYLTTILGASNNALLCSDNADCPTGSACIGSTGNQDGVCCTGKPDDECGGCAEDEECVDTGIRCVTTPCPSWECRKRENTITNLDDRLCGRCSANKVCEYFFPFYKCVDKCDPPCANGECGERFDAACRPCPYNKFCGDCKKCAMVYVSYTDSYSIFNRVYSMCVPNTTNIKCPGGCGQDEKCVLKMSLATVLFSSQRETPTPQCVKVDCHGTILH